MRSILIAALYQANPESWNSQIPPFLIVDFDGTTPIDLGSIFVMGSHYELISATRLLPGITNHFISYIRVDGNWFRYDGIGPRVRSVVINSELDFEGNRSLFYYAKCIKGSNM